MAKNLPHTENNEATNDLHKYMIKLQLLKETVIILEKLHGICYYDEGMKHYPQEDITNIKEAFTNTAKLAKMISS